MSNPSKRRVVVTGLGAVTPCGNNARDTWSNVRDGITGIDTITRFDVSGFSCKIGGEVHDFNTDSVLDKKDQRRLDRVIQFSVVASNEAVTDSSLDVSRIDKERFGVLIGSGIGGIETVEKQHKILLEKGPGKVSPFLIPMMIVNMGSGEVSIRLGFKGPNSSVVTACASGNNAIGDAFRMIQNGYADGMITGGSEAAVTPLGFAGFCSLQAMSKRNDDPKHASRPFDKTRDGFVMSEGAGVLLLEELEHAKKRNARIYAEIIGYGLAGDACHITAPPADGNGARRAMEAAIKDAGIKPEDIQYINAHGTSTQLNDKIETLAIKKVFKEHAYKLAVSSTKSTTGHLLGGAGGVESIISVMSIVEETIPPTINFFTPDPECDLDYVTNQKRSAKIDVVLSNTLGFGGHNATLIFKRYVPEDEKKD